MAAPVLTLIGKPGCHLCDEARDVVTGVVREANDGGTVATLEERSILDDPALEEKYRDLIPVLLIDGDEHAHWRVDAARLSEALGVSR